MAQPTENDQVPAGYMVIYRAWILRAGKRVYPPAGKKSWRLVVKIKP